MDEDLGRGGGMTGRAASETGADETMAHVTRRRHSAVKQAT